MLMNSEEKSMTVGCTVCRTINAQAGTVCRDKVCPQPWKYLIAAVSDTVKRYDLIAL